LGLSNHSSVLFKRASSVWEVLFLSRKNTVTYSPNTSKTCPPHSSHGFIPYVLNFLLIFYYLIYELSSSEKANSILLKKSFALQIIMHFKSIFFDNDGILVDTEPIYAQAIQKVFDDIGYSENARKLYIQAMKDGGSVFEKVGKNQGWSSEKILSLREKQKQQYSKLLSQKIPVMPYAKEVLKKLHPHFVMGMVTSSRGNHLKSIHRDTNLLQYFDFILKREDFDNAKPHPDSYLKALEKADCKKSECLVIEDSERGLFAAKEAGLTCFVIPTDMTRKMDFSRADQVLSNLDELIKILL